MWSYSPILKVTPPAGPALAYDLAAIDRLIACQWIPEAEFAPKTTLRRRRVNIPYGWRLRYVFAWFIDTPSGTSELTLVDIAFAVNRMGYKLEMSMDGGATYREVVLDAWPPRTNVEEKNVAAIYRAEFVSAEILSEDSAPPETRQSPPGIAVGV